MAVFSAGGRVPLTPDSLSTASAAPFSDQAPAQRSCCDLKSWVRRRCPSVALFLRTVGYEDALVLKNCVHGMLWCCCIISFVFSMLWLSKVLTLNCGKNVFWPTSLVKGSWRCLMYFIGFIVFFASFRDLVRMLAHFDDHKQVLLKKKRRLLKEVSDGCRNSLALSAETVRQLRDRVAKELAQKVEQILMKLFSEVLPTLRKARLRSGNKTRSVDAEVRELSLLIRGALHRDIGGPAEEMLGRMVENFPQVFDQLDQGLGCDPEQPAPPLAFVTSTVLEPPPQSEYITAAVADDVWRSWHLRAYGYALDAAAAPPPRGRGQSDASRGASVLLAGAAAQARVIAGGGGDEEEANVQQLSALLTRIFFEPAEKLVSVQHHLHVLEHSHEESSKDTEIPRRKQRFGFCTPLPPSTDSYRWIVIKCCLCRLFAAHWRMLCGRRAAACVERGLKYQPPKTIKLGCVWIQIHSKLQERLLQGLAGAFAFLVFSAWDSYMDWQSWDMVCTKNNVTECLTQAAMMFCSMLSLLVYCIALMPLLWNIDRLDAVMETILTICQVEEIRGAVLAFNRCMLFVETETSFLQVVLDRLLMRWQLLEAFARLFCYDDTMSPEEQAMGLSLVVRTLQDIEARLPLAAEWVDMEVREQRAATEEAQRLTVDGVEKLESLAEVARASLPSGAPGHHFERSPSASFPDESFQPAVRLKA